MIMSGGQGSQQRCGREKAVRRHRLFALGLVGTGVAVVAACVFRGGSEGAASVGSEGAVSVGSKASASVSSAPTALRATGTTRSGAPAAPRPTGDVRIAAVGDIVMGTLPDDLPPDGGASFFDSVDDLLAGDVVLGNLESTLTTGGTSKCDDIGGSNCFAFHVPPSYARWIKKAGFTVMNTANNHIDDFGEEGRRQTFAALRSVNLPYTGRLGQITIQRVHGIRVALVGFAPDRGASDLTDIPAAKRLIARAATMADIVVVTMHAGAEGSDRTHVQPGTEYFLGEDRGDSYRFSRAVIDAGADLVVGSGPHVMRGMEFYKNRLIAYSLGNFSGYKVLGLGGNLSTSGVLQVSLRADGTYVSGRLRPTRIVEPGTPEPGGEAIDLVSSVSDEDFGSNAARIAEDGTIRHP
ncbi:CapA family protein [Streptomyces sp. 142MFCol3.1]|uniref:CapA family protein n=1 Tax=Streptomyces sp. 142MFCol3.1 TaxID=1172179 RepID=UPI000427C49F|nr:CapA family protein [Streptomyces sp. 142MFCol3.1]